MLVIFGLFIFGLLTSTAFAQQLLAPNPQPGTIIGTVLDVNGGTIPDATVTLSGASRSDIRKLEANDNGFFQFANVPPGVTYHLHVSANGFRDWTSPDIVVQPGSYLNETGVELQVAEAVTTVRAVVSSDEIATEQVQLEEKQRILGVLPNFYTTYDYNAAPLSTKLKYQLAFRVLRDPATFVAVGFLAGIDQASDTPNYVQGMRGYGERYGANLANFATGFMIGGAVLPSLLHQDPRYFYQGTGTTESRLIHALANPFIAKGDDGRWEPNYSSMGGDLASGALSNLYYPASNRGAGLVFSSFAVASAGRMMNGVLQEFVLRRFTPSEKKH